MWNKRVYTRGTIRSQKGRTATLSILKRVSAKPGDSSAVVCPGTTCRLLSSIFLSLFSARTDFGSGGSSAVVCAGITRRARACAHEDALGTFKSTWTRKFQVQTWRLFKQEWCKAYASNTIEETADTWRQTEGGAKRRLAWGEQWRRYRHECGR